TRVIERRDVRSDAPDPTRARVIAAFGAGGALAGHVAGFVPRASQAEMAATVYDTIVHGGTLVAEAGTGTGKTFAYLVAVLLAGGKVLVSTGTKPLQDQLFRKDLPAVLESLRLNVDVALLKGRANYVCLHRLDRAETEGLLPTREDTVHLRSIRRFVSETSTGDRAELPGVPENAGVWPLVTSTRDNCLGAECPRFTDCFLFKARRAAQAADVVVVNHHLFLADLAMREDSIRDFLPAVDVVVLDEAHQLPSIAADFFGVTLSLGQLLEAGRDARSLGLSRASDGASWALLTSRFERAVRDVRLALAECGLLAGSRTPLDRIARREMLQDAVNDLGGLAAEVGRALEVNRGRDGELDLLAARFADLRRQVQDWGRALGERAGADEAPEPEDEPSVRWVAVSAHGAQFNKTPLAPGQALARVRETQHQPWILTSATLTTAGRFDHFLAELGITGCTTARWDSPFDFGKQGLFYLPKNLPSPSDSHFQEHVAEAAWPLIRANGGRAFVLCTTLRAVDRVARRLGQLMADEGVDFPLLIQGESTRRALIDRFRAAGNAVLVGSISFWEGIDIRGETLSLVVIDKLPFAPPDDPVVEARIRHLKRCGRNAFNEYQLPEAVMLMKQGAGRLIRDEHDRGVLMVLDERLVTKSYGRTVLNSLPAFARTRSEDDAVAFLSAGREEAA
ncbi:MAG: ATP-dependent DNA helicase, partial [Burkholderiaceae bacterium]|nr:ATP-dependent DNA helicase [Burkholderiaceae bacterium]